MKDLLLIVAASGEAPEGARVFHVELQVTNVEPRGKKC